MSRRRPIDTYEDVDGQRSFALEDGELEKDVELTPEEPAEFADFIGLAGHAQGHDEQSSTTTREADEPGVAGPGRDVDAHELTPAGRYRASVTDDPEFCLARAHGPIPGAVNGRGGQAGHEWPGADREGAGGGARALRDRLEVVGQVSGPHITRYEIRLAPGVKDVEGREPEGRPRVRLAATDIRILAPIPGKTAVG